MTKDACRFVSLARKKYRVGIFEPGVWIRVYIKISWALLKISKFIKWSKTYEACLYEIQERLLLGINASILKLV